MTAPFVHDSRNSDRLRSLRGRDVLGLAGLTAEEVTRLLALAASMKQGSDHRDDLAGRHLGMLFSVPSTRTRVSFQVAARQLGADIDSYHPDELRLANNETYEDTARVLSRYLDALIVRHYDMDHYGRGAETLSRLAHHASIPVINALDDQEHPCQVLADLLTVQERFGDLRSARITLMWSYSSRQKTPAVLHSWLVAAAALGLTVTFAHPPHFDLDESFRGAAATSAATSGARMETTHDRHEAVRGADVVYTQSWKSLTLPGDAEWKARTAARDWRVTDELMGLASTDGVYMDCLPSNRGEEVDAAVKDGPRSIIYDQAENRLHVQKALLASVLGR